MGKWKIKNFTTRAIISGTNNLTSGSESLTNSYIFEGGIFFTSTLTERKMKEKEINKSCCIVSKI